MGDPRPTPPPQLHVVHDEGPRPPAAPRMELEVLSAVLVAQGGEAFDIVHGLLKPEDFHHQRHAQLWEAMVACHKRNGVVDPPLVGAEMGDTWDAWGLDLVMRALDRVGTVSSVEHYARIVAEKAHLRRLLDATQRIQTAIYAGDFEPGSAANDAERILREASVRSLAKEPTTVASGLEAHMAKVHLAQTMEPGQFLGLRTGVAALDARTNGLQPGWLVVVTARSGGGKSALAVNNFALTAAKAGHVAAIFSVEMQADEVSGRLLAAESGVPYNIQCQRMRNTDVAAIDAARPVIAGLPIVIDDDAGPTIEDIATKARRIERRHGRLDLVIVDYIQLMPGSLGKNATRERELAHITRGCKKLAKELRCVVVALSQPTLDATRAKGRMGQGASKGAQAIEADADLVLEPAKGIDKDPHAAVIGLNKFRHGPCEDVKQGQVAWSGRRMRFEDPGMGRGVFR